MKTKENSNLRKNLVERVSEVRDYYLSGNTIEQTALEFGVSTSTMTRFLREHQISKKRRNLSDPMIIEEMRSKIVSLLPTNTITSICKE